MAKGPEFSLRISPEATEDELAFARQLGARYVYAWVEQERTTFEFLDGLRRKVNQAGLELYNVGCSGLAKSDAIHLGLPNAAERIEAFQDFVRNLGKAGIPVTTTTWEPDNVWRTMPRKCRGARASAVDMRELEAQPWTHGRVYTSEEVWATFSAFIHAMAPVLREAGVHLALHPNDPPVASVAGIACLINSQAAYDRAFALAPADVLQMEFCCGCWLEGGPGFGDIQEGIRRYVAEGRVALVHFRNVSAPLPRFHETFLDNGYADMYALMRAFCEAGYEGPMTFDHTPVFAGAYHAGAAPGYAIGYMRALKERALAELG